MTKNTQVETTQKSQATKKDKTPTGKIKTIKSAEERKKAREQEYRNFRINSLRRRCERYGFDKEKTEEYVKKLLEQLDAPKEYSILVFIAAKHSKMMNEALKNASINYKYCGATFFSIDGDKNVLDKLREIAPEGTKIHIYAKKMESVIPKEDVPEKPSVKNKNVTHSRPKGKNVAKKRPNIAGMSKKNRKIFKARVKTLRDKWKAEKASKKASGTVVQMTHKKPSKGFKKASTNFKKAA